MEDHLPEKAPPDIVERTFQFGQRVIRLFLHLGRRLPALGSVYNQCLRSGTAVGALVEEAQAAESKNDFIHKMAIALKEAREAHYWLRQLQAAEVMESEKLDPIVREATELKLVLGAIIASSKGTRKQPTGR